MSSIMFNVKELAEYLNISESFLRKLIRFGKIPYNKLGAKLLFSKVEIDKWLLEQQNNNQ